MKNMNLAEVKAAIVGIRIHYEDIGAGKQQLEMIDKMLKVLETCSNRLAIARTLLNSWRNSDNKEWSLRAETDKWLWSEE